MPLYSYRCPRCGHQFEELKSFSEEAFATCPACGATDIEHGLGRPAIRFKGKGWYVSDYGKGHSAYAASDKGDATPSSCPSAGSTPACDCCPKAENS